MLNLKLKLKRKPVAAAGEKQKLWTWYSVVLKFFVANENYASLNNQVVAINYTLHQL